MKHGPRGVRLIPGDGPGLHLSMYGDFVSGDDESGGAHRESRRVTEGSEP
jgi:hypothetical protein